MRKAADEKIAGQEVTIAPEQPAAQIIDLFEALKQSLSEAEETRATGTDDGAPAPSSGRKKSGKSLAKGPRKARATASSAKKRARG